jgi:hypothetical protein
MSELATPSGIDHDYNFLHSIEHRLERSEKLLVEDIDALSRAELQRARAGEDEEEWKRRHEKEARGEACIARTLREMKCSVITAPKGMRRNKENTTGWNRRHGTIHWQVEWMRGKPAGRTLYRVLGNHAIGKAYDLICEEERILAMSPEEKRADKKRKANEFKAAQARKAKKARLDAGRLPQLSTTSVLQDPERRTWDFTPVYMTLPEALKEDSPEPEPTIPQRNYHLYLQRPLTPSSFPKVLVPLDLDKTLTDLLRKREVLEFPTIYVLDHPPEDLPEKFMLEMHYLVAIGKERGEESDSDTDMSDSSEEHLGDSSGSSDEDSDESMEEGEIL